MLSDTFIGSDEIFKNIYTMTNIIYNEKPGQSCLF